MERREFTFQGAGAGAFDGDAELGKLGRVRYEPYRNRSHYDLGQVIENEGFATVEVDDGGVCRTLKVSLPEYGVLEIMASHERTKRE